MNAADIEGKLKAQFPDAQVKVTDLTGGGDHWQVEVTTAAFQGKPLVIQHQLVYKALGDWMQGPIHALALTTRAL